MTANINPIWTNKSNVTGVKIGTASAQTRTDGTSAGTGTDLMYQAFAAGENGSFVQSVRLLPVVNIGSAVTSVATTLRVYYSTITGGVTGQAVGATTANETHLMHEISVTALSVGANAGPYTEIPINRVIPAGSVILVSQSVAQNANGQWQALVFGGDY